jgi:hypothetical protein
MGADWSRHPRLRNEDDWVRREILEAYAHGIRVIPILKGRKTERLNAVNLPAELARLAEVQYLRLDTRDNEADLRHIGDELADLVPSLKEADRAEQPAAPDGVRNSANDIRGTVAQGHTVGDVGTIIKGNSGGTFHTGKGDIYQNPKYFSWRHPGDSRVDEDEL